MSAKIVYLTQASLLALYSSKEVWWPFGVKKRVWFEIILHSKKLGIGIAVHLFFLFFFSFLAVSEPTIGRHTGDSALSTTKQRRSTGSKLLLLPDIQSGPRENQFKYVSYGFYEYI